MIDFNAYLTKVNMTTTKNSRQSLKERRDERLLLKQSSLLIEAMNADDFKKATAIIDKFKGMMGKGSKTLDAAIQGAIDELNRYTAGGPLQKLKGVVGFANPLNKFTTFANALENGLKLMPQILKNNLVGVDLKANKDKTISDLIPDENKRKVLTNNMLKALSPKGIFGAFKKVPYVNTNDLVQDLVNIPISNLSTIVQQSDAGPNTEQIAADIKDTFVGKGDVESKATTPPTPGQPGEGTKTTTPGKKSAGNKPTTPIGSTPPKTKQAANIRINNVYNKLSLQLQDAAGSERNAKAVLKILADEGII